MSRLPITVRDIMITNIVTIEYDRPVEEALRLMLTQERGGKHIGSVIVTKYGSVVGIVTERDFLTRVLSAGIDIKRTKVEEVMSSPVITCVPSISIFEAADKMRTYRIRHLPVMEEDKLVGIVASYDLAKHASWIALP